MSAIGGKADIDKPLIKCRAVISLGQQFLPDHELFEDLWRGHQCLA
jgi:hypothetical protein